MAQQRNKPRRTKILIDNELTEMYELLSQGLTDREMIAKLGISESTYYWYKNKLYERFGSIQKAKTDDTVYYQQMLLSERLTKLYRLSELKLTKDIKHMTGTEIAAVGSIAQELAINILKLETEGIRATNRQLNRIVKPLTDIATNTNNAEHQINTDNHNNDDDSNSSYS